jgi:hypothetical protein
VDGSDFCARHSNEADRVRGYRLSNPELRERVEQHAGEASLESVRNEIILLRALIEDRLEMASTKAERLAAFQSVTPTLVNVVKCCETLAKLERQNSVVLGKEALMGLGKQIIHILSEELDGVPGYDSVVDRIAARIAKTIAESRNQE